jgi:menaquinone-dependent protoporphyrinogen oxidase
LGSLLQKPCAMRVLVTWGSQRGGTEGLARMVASALENEGFEVVLEPAEKVDNLSGFDAVIVGGALYANRWHRAASKLLRVHSDELRTLPVWCFSSGPLDDTADHGVIPPTRQVTALMERVGARGHATFGGRLTRDAQGFVASKMAEKMSGDWRDRAHVEAWTKDVATSLRAMPTVRRKALPPKRNEGRVLLATLCLLAGITAIWGGLELVLSPDGSFMRLPLSLLEHTAFHDFRIPGLILAIVVGGINTLAGVMVLRRHARANAEALVAGAVLTGWIAVEVLLLRQTHWLHIVYVALGLAIMAVAADRSRRAGELADTVRGLARFATYAFVGWALCGATMALLLAATSTSTALLVHALAAPIIFAAVAASYFRSPTAWSPLRTAILFAAVVGLLDLVVVANFIEHSLAMFQSFVGSWLPLLLIALATWTVGTLQKHGPAVRPATTSS